MSTVESVAARLAAILADLPTDALRLAADHLDQVAALVAEAIDGTGNDLLGDALAALVTARDAALDALDALDAGTEHVTAYLAVLGFATPPAPPAGPDPAQDEPAPPACPPEPRNLLAELAAWSSGDKTRGLWVDAEGTKHPLISGQHEPWFDQAKQRAVELGLVPAGATMITAADVELKFATRMRAHGIMKATIVINKTPCIGRLGCQRNLPDFLPDGSELTVYAPNGYRRTFHGRGRHDDERR